MWIWSANAEHYLDPRAQRQLAKWIAQKARKMLQPTMATAGDVQRASERSWQQMEMEGLMSEQHARHR